METPRKINWHSSLKSAYLCLVAACSLVPLSGASAEQQYCPADRPARCGGPSGTQWANSWTCCTHDQVCGIYREDLHPFCQNIFTSAQESEDCFSAAYGDFQQCILRYNRQRVICEGQLQSIPGSTSENIPSCELANQMLDECGLKYDVDYFNCRQRSDGWERPSLPKAAPPATSSGSDDNPSVPTDLAPFTG